VPGDLCGTVLALPDAGIPLQLQIEQLTMDEGMPRDLHLETATQADGQRRPVPDPDRVERFQQAASIGSDGNALVGQKPSDAVELAR
jgi:hypothetical protein